VQVRDDSQPVELDTQAGMPFMNRPAQSPSVQQPRRLHPKTPVTPQNLSENRYNDYNSIREPVPDRILELQTRLREEEGRCESLQQEIDEKNLHIGTLERQLHEVQTHQIEAIDNNALSEPAQLESRYKMLRAVLLQYREKNMLLSDRLEASEARERDLRALLQRAQQDL
jgi:chromosome segregation ATPase